MAKKRVYVESTVISYLAAKPSRVLANLVKQQHTWDWWECRHRWNMYISPAVIREIRRGRPKLARKRLAYIVGMPVLQESDEIGALTDHLIDKGLIPEKVRDDALHVATAVLHGMDYLVGPEKGRGYYELSGDSCGFG